MMPGHKGQLGLRKARRNGPLPLHLGQLEAVALRVRDSGGDGSVDLARRDKAPLMPPEAVMVMKGAEMMAAALLEGEAALFLRPLHPCKRQASKQVFQVQKERGGAAPRMKSQCSMRSLMRHPPPQSLLYSAHGVPSLLLQPLPLPWPLTTIPDPRNHLSGQ